MDKPQSTDKVAGKITDKIVFTKQTATFLLKEALRARETIEASLNLGKSKTKIVVRNGFFEVLGQRVEIRKLERLKENTIYTIEEEKVLAVELFSEKTNLYYKLRPTKDWPTLMLSSVPMHRFVSASPKESATRMVELIKPVKGKVLDTCGGLGYTAIISANSGAGKVICYEIDESVLEMAKYNPYSKELFENEKIELRHESVLEGIKNLPNESFDRIIHDPPTMSFAKELYQKEFYDELFRVLKKGGKLYHYAPNPKKTKGAEFWKTIIKILTKSGFANADYVKTASGITAQKL